MDKEKKQWTKPELIVLSDWKPDEFALLSCNDPPVFGGTCGENTVVTTS